VGAKSFVLQNLAPEIKLDVKKKKKMTSLNKSGFLIT
jgi:hypothetical protein